MHQDILHIFESFLGVKKMRTILIFIILLSLSSCKGIDVMSLKEQKNEIINSLHQDTKDLIGSDRCIDIDNMDGVSFSCYVSKKGNSELFQIVLKDLSGQGFKAISAVRQDYGIWSVILSSQGKDLVIRSESLSSIKEGEFFNLRQKGYNSRLELTLSKSKS